MKLAYDLRHNIAYLHLREGTAEVQTLHISEELNVDIAPDGTVYGIELLNANEQIGKSGLLQVTNDATHKTAEFKLPG